jgi:hypothetical protein
MILKDKLKMIYKRLANWKNNTLAQTLQFYKIKIPETTKTSKVLTVDDLQREVLKEKQKNRKARRMIDLLFALLIALLVSIGIHTSKPLDPNGDPRRSNIAECWVMPDGNLQCKNAKLVELKNRNVNLYIPKNLDAAKLVAAEDQLISADVKTIQKAFKP